MYLSQKNIGDMLMFPDTGRRLRIDNVTDRFVYYTSETGEKYCTSERFFSACQVTDDTVIAEFEKNAALGRLLSAAEVRALRTILDGRNSFREREEAACVLNMVNTVQRHLQSQLSQQSTIETHKHSGLQDKIRNAEARCSCAISSSDQNPKDRSR